VISPSQRPLPDNTQTSMPPVGFEPTIPASERPQTYALDCAATVIGYYYHLPSINERQVDCSASSRVWLAP